MQFNYCPSSAYHFVLWSVVIAKKISLRIFITFHRKKVSLSSGKGNIGWLLICILQAWKLAFKQNFWFSITGKPLCFVNYNAIWRQQWEWRRHAFSHVWTKLLSFARWKSICKWKKNYLKWFVIDHSASVVRSKWQVCPQVLATDTVFPGCCTCSSACTLAFRLASASHEQAVCLRQTEDLLCSCLTLKQASQPAA